MNISPRRRYRWLVLVPLLLALGSCAGVREAVLPPVQLWQIAREVPGADPRWQRADAATAGVRVWRGGREIAVQRLMELLPGDEIETGANAAAVLRFRDAGDTLVLEEGIAGLPAGEAPDWSVTERNAAKSGLTQTQRTDVEKLVSEWRPNAS